MDNIPPKQTAKDLIQKIFLETERSENKIHSYSKLLSEGNISFTDHFVIVTKAVKKLQWLPNGPKSTKKVIPIHFFLIGYNKQFFFFLSHKNKFFLNSMKWSWPSDQEKPVNKPDKDNIRLLPPTVFSLKKKFISIIDDKTKYYMQ